ncbi:hypothetical protein [Lewinella sp. IMCC34183]|uniref:hypothetical protein n=1 Tax=Lewinella sp. IMCC34183 TaxID=2248762 RepID=UPI000E2792B9|nr:hypothetical protein [Lewinella sp. IMCC34183]
MKYHPFYRYHLLYCLFPLLLLACGDDNDDRGETFLRVTVDGTLDLEAVAPTAVYYESDRFLQIEATYVDDNSDSYAILLAITPESGGELTTRQYATSGRCSNTALSPCVSAFYASGALGSAYAYRSTNTSYPGSVEINLDAYQESEDGYVSGTFSANVYDTNGELITLTDGVFNNLPLTLD